MVKDRRYHLRMYPKCFVGSEAVDRLIKHAGVKDRSTAALMLNVLQRHNVIHHVCDDHQFKDTYLFYRFRVDDGTLPLSRETELYIKGHQLYHEQTLLGNSSVLKLHNESGVMYDKSFHGAQLVNWLVKSNKCSTRQEAIGLGKDLLELRLIQHVTNEHHFKDERLLYVFHPDLSQLKVIDLLDIHERPRSLSLDSSMFSQKQKLASPCQPIPPVPPKSPQMPDATAADSRPKFQIGSPEQEESQNLMSESDNEDLSGSRFQDSHGSGAVRFSQSPTAEELKNPDESCRRQTLQILGDSVGFGFVIRGDGPSYVQTVDPSGPAAKAGLKIGQFLYFVNGEYVLNKDHVEVAHIILRNPQQLTMDVLVPRHQASQH
ncbi:DEP domain-containing mTOR-interacting protein-like isoform X2 [Acanthaster planci]|nr:DEP domain-containing mTOR-interacting protein-like isoform X2 [Acanthaster planci]